MDLGALGTCLGALGLILGDIGSLHWSMQTLGVGLSGDLGSRDARGEVYCEGEGEGARGYGSHLFGRRLIPSFLASTAHMDLDHSK